MGTDRDTEPVGHPQDGEGTGTGTSGPPWRPSGRSVVGAVLQGAGAYGAAWLMAFLVIILTLSSLARVDTGGSGGLPDELAGVAEAGVDGDPRSVLAVLLIVPTQLVGMAFFSPLDLSAAFEVFGLSLTLTGTLTWIPLTVTLTAALVAASASYLGQRRRSHGWPRSAVLAASSGGTVAVLAWVLAAVTAVNLQEEGLRVAAAAASPIVLPGAFLVVAAAALVGAAAARRGTSRTPTPVRQVGAALQVLVLHYVLVSVLAGVALLVLAWIRVGPEVVPSALAWLPTVTGYAYGLIHLAPARAVLGTDIEVQTVFDLPWWAWLTALVVLLLATLVAALAWAARTRALPPVPALLSWSVLPVVFLAGGALVTELTRVAGSVVGVPGVTAAGYALVPWTCLVLAGWGLVITLLARIAAPAVLATWPRLARLPVLGTRGTGPDPAPAVGGAPARRVKWLVATGGVLVLLLIGAVITINVVNQSVYGPDKPVEAYLDELVAGDVDAAHGVLPSAIGEDRDALLDDRVYGAAAHRISSYLIRDSSRTDDTATVTAELTQDGAVSTIDFELTRTGATGVFFDEWRLDGPEPLKEISMVVPEELQVLTINGTEVDLPAGDTGRYAGMRSVVLPALPGEYTISPPSASTYLSYGQEQSVMIPVDPAGVPRGVLLSTTPTPAAEAEAVAEVRAALDACIASAEASPQGCPNRAFLFGTANTIRGPGWTLDDEPTFSFEESYRPGVFTLLSDDAEATFSYERNAEVDSRKPPRWVPEEDTVRLYLRATVTVTAESVDVQVE